MNRTWEQIGAMVKARREDLQLTQSELADRAGLSLAIVQVVEGGRKSSYRRSTLVAITKALGWPDDAFDRLQLGEDLHPAEMFDPSEPPISLSASGVDLEQLRRVDPDAYELIMVQARAALERARARGRR